MSKSKITVTVEIDGFAVTETVEDFVGGNPLFHAQCTGTALDPVSQQVTKTIAHRFGDIRDRRAKKES